MAKTIATQTGMHADSATRSANREKTTIGWRRGSLAHCGNDALGAAETAGWTPVGRAGCGACGAGVGASAGDEDGAAFVTGRAGLCIRGAGRAGPDGVGAD